MTSDLEHPYEIAVVKTYGPVGSLISKVTDDVVSHAYIVLPDKIVNMEPKGAVERPLGYWGEAVAYSQMNLKPSAQLAFADYANTAVRDRWRYDWFGDFIVGVGDILTGPHNPPSHLFGLVEKHLDSTRRAFCSDFADAAAHHAGFEIFDDGRPFHAVTPGDLHLRFTELGWAQAA